MRTAKTLVILAASVVLVWAGLQGYQVWYEATEGPTLVAPVGVMQSGFKLCLDTAARGFPGVYYGYALGTFGDRATYWTCVGLFRADYAYNWEAMGR